MLEMIIRDLAENYRESDKATLSKMIDRVTADALSISNRKHTCENVELLSNEIIECVKGLYLNRGAEGSNSLSDGGKSTSFKNPVEQMRLEIVKSGKRVPRL